MSTERKIHLEPFIRIPLQYEDVVREFYTCENHHFVNKKHLFCSACGKEAMVKHVSEKSPLWYSDLSGDENLSQWKDGETLYLFSNISAFKGRVDTNEFNLTPITPELIDQMKEEFRKFHCDDISFLEEKLGIKITVEFGFLYEVY